MSMCIVNTVGYCEHSYYLQQRCVTMFFKKLLKVATCVNSVSTYKLCSLSTVCVATYVASYFQLASYFNISITYVVIAVDVIAVRIANMQKYLQC